MLFFLSGLESYIPGILVFAQFGLNEMCPFEINPGSDTVLAYSSTFFHEFSSSCHLPFCSSAQCGAFWIPNLGLGRNFWNLPDICFIFPLCSIMSMQQGAQAYGTPFPAEREVCFPVLKIKTTATQKKQPPPYTFLSVLGRFCHFTLLRFSTA